MFNPSTSNSQYRSCHTGPSSASYSLSKASRDCTSILKRFHALSLPLCTLIQRPVLPKPTQTLKIDHLPSDAPASWENGTWQVPSQLSHSGNGVHFSRPQCVKWSMTCIINLIGCRQAQRFLLRWLPGWKWTSNSGPQQHVTAKTTNSFYYMVFSKSDNHLIWFQHKISHNSSPSISVAGFWNPYDTWISMNFSLKWRRSK